LAGAACEKKAAPPDPPRPVLTQVVGEAADSELFSYSGEVRSRYETPLAFRIPGKISARLVDAGAVVKAGDVLARLDPADTALSAAAATAQLELASAELQRFRSLVACQVGLRAGCLEVGFTRLERRLTDEVPFAQAAETLQFGTRQFQLCCCCGG
jgi:multidrug efflux pump subunit AcrA (membrane-fusion protein)